jgi:hypothetical protein
MTPMGHRETYRWDVFLSYKRRGEWPYWIRKHFIPLLEHHVGEELDSGPTVRIYWDDAELAAGPDYPPVLATELSSSAVLVPLLSKQYLGSPYCLVELEAMRRREKMYGFRTTVNLASLIVPVVVHDGDEFPKDISRMQAVPLQALTNPRMSKHSPLAEQLSDRIREKLARPLARAIEAAPAYDAAWLNFAVAGMEHAFDVAPPRQLTVPGREA